MITLTLQEALRYRKNLRVWINCPSTLQPHHELHGRRCITCPQPGDDGRVTTVFFTEGRVHSMRIDTLYLSLSD